MEINHSEPPRQDLTQQPQMDPNANGSSSSVPHAEVQREQDWKSIYGNEPPPDDAGQAGSLDETLTVVKERMWFFGDAALKGVAEVLVGFGISPTVLGYSEEELLEDEEYEEGPARPPLQKDEVVSKTSYAFRSEEKLSRRRADDPASASSGLLASPGPAPAMLAPESEQYAMEVGWGSDEGLEFGEDKKDK